MEYIKKIIELYEHLPAWVGAIGTALLGLKSITMLTPTKSDNAILDNALKVINFLALNVLKDKNKDA